MFNVAIPPYLNKGGSLSCTEANHLANVIKEISNDAELQLGAFVPNDVSLYLDGNTIKVHEAGDLATVDAPLKAFVDLKGLAAILRLGVKAQQAAELQVLSQLNAVESLPGYPALPTLPPAPEQRAEYVKLTASPTVMPKREPPFVADGILRDILEGDVADLTNVCTTIGSHALLRRSSQYIVDHSRAAATGKLIHNEGHVRKWKAAAFSSDIYDKHNGVVMREVRAHPEHVAELYLSLQTAHRKREQSVNSYRANLRDAVTAANNIRVKKYQDKHTAATKLELERRQRLQVLADDYAKRRADWQSECDVIMVKYTAELDEFRSASTLMANEKITEIKKLRIAVPETEQSLLKDLKTMLTNAESTLEAS